MKCQAQRKLPPIIFAQQIDLLQIYDHDLGNLENETLYFLCMVVMKGSLFLNPLQMVVDRGQI